MIADEAGSLPLVVLTPQKLRLTVQEPRQGTVVISQHFLVASENVDGETQPTLLDRIEMKLIRVRHGSAPVVSPPLRCPRAVGPTSNRETLPHSQAREPDSHGSGWRSRQRSDRS